MTGFGRAQGATGNAETAGGTWLWELRAVNGKGLDVRLKLPHGYDQLEQQCRKLFSQHLERGNIQASLTLTLASNQPVPTINEPALDAVLEALALVENRYEASRPTGTEILSMRGVMELAEPPMDTGDKATLDTAITEGLAFALSALNEHRVEEGAAMATVLNSHLDTIEILAKRAAADPSLQVDTVRERMRQQVASLLEGHSGFDETRLHQEAALLATRGDVREELDRLNAHIVSGRALLANGSPVGRKLEFLAQEFNRECNTLCSKSQAVSLTETGLELKVVIDQFREQVLNVE